MAQVGLRPDARAVRPGPVGASTAAAPVHAGTPPGPGLVDGVAQGLRLFESERHAVDGAFAAAACLQEAVSGFEPESVDA